LSLQSLTIIAFVLLSCPATNQPKIQTNDVEKWNLEMEPQ